MCQPGIASRVKRELAGRSGKLGPEPLCLVVVTQLICKQAGGEKEEGGPVVQSSVHESCSRIRDASGCTCDGMTYACMCEHAGLKH